MPETKIYPMARPSTSNCQNTCANGSNKSKSSNMPLPSGPIHNNLPYMEQRLICIKSNDNENEAPTLHNSQKSKKISEPLRRCIPFVLHMSTVFTFLWRLLILSMFCGFGLVAGQPIGGSRCFYFGPGMTIPGGDYRRDFDVTQGMCAQACREDACCMAFEFASGECTLKSRSLNGTIAPKAEAFFGLCLDYEDDARERFWDHELGGIELAVQPELERDACDVFCHDIPGSVIYSWRTSDARNVDAELGECRCISVLQSVKLSFGSFSGPIDPTNPAMATPGKGKEFVPFPDGYDSFIVVPSDKIHLGPDPNDVAKFELTNKGDLPVLYKAKCTSNKRIGIPDCVGIVEPGKSGEVNIKRRKFKADSPDMICIVYTLMGELGGDNALYQWRRANDQQIPTKNIIIEVTV